MKLYSSRQTYKNELDRFVGKDVWVLVDVEFEYRNRLVKRREWARILESLNLSDNYEGYVSNLISCDDLRRISDDEYHYRYVGINLHTDLTDRRYLNKDYFKLSKPLEILTTEELLEMIVV